MSLTIFDHIQYINLFNSVGVYLAISSPLLYRNDLLSKMNHFGGSFPRLKKKRQKACMIGLPACMIFRLIFFSWVPSAGELWGPVGPLICICKIISCGNSCLFPLGLRAFLLTVCLVGWTPQPSYESVRPSQCRCLVPCQGTTWDCSVPASWWGVYLKVPAAPILWKAPLNESMFINMYVHKHTHIRTQTHTTGSICGPAGNCINCLLLLAPQRTAFNELLLQCDAAAYSE